MTKKIAIINGPNLNLLGLREQHIYGSQSFTSYLEKLEQDFPQFSLSYYQSNVEGDLVTAIQDLGFQCDALVINAAAYSHTSIAIPDAVTAVPAKCVGVHISNIYQREEERHIDLLAKACDGCIFGFGLDGYRLALNYFNNYYNEQVTA